MEQAQGARHILLHLRIRAPPTPQAQAPQAQAPQAQARQAQARQAQAPLLPARAQHSVTQI
jgi:hypothetical protein